MLHVCTYNTTGNPIIVLLRSLNIHVHVHVHVHVHAYNMYDSPQCHSNSISNTLLSQQNYCTLTVLQGNIVGDVTWWPNG